VKPPDPAKQNRQKGYHGPSVTSLSMWPYAEEGLPATNDCVSVMRGHADGSSSLSLRES
jgi:hypothetical protein